MPSFKTEQQAPAKKGTRRDSCHCGQIQFEVVGELTGATDCNCSVCQRKGTLMWFVSQPQLNLLTPRDALRSYTFYKHASNTSSAPTCGMQPFGEGTDPKGNAMAAVNVRCLEGVDVYAIPANTLMGGRVGGADAFALKVTTVLIAAYAHCMWAGG